jgi:hypothetical protein
MQPANVNNFKQLLMLTVETFLHLKLPQLCAPRLPGPYGDLLGSGQLSDILFVCVISCLCSPVGLSTKPRLFEELEP